MKEIELLAPAKDLECGISAINCGADAVYIGAKNFGARSNAGNELEDLSKLIDFAHKYYAKIYITVNTILTDEELPHAQRLIKNLYELNADGIIIQDLGLLELDLPPIPLIGSTQMHNASLEKIKFLEQAGLKRVILARELSLEEIKGISENTTIELEAFIHGALCVSYSGQCYLSYAIGGRSGNRGECAQPCRKTYSLLDNDDTVIAKNQYLLSLKDLNRSNHIEDMINSGITSFKIEGRLKNANYIKNIVTFYRQEIDKVLTRTGNKKTSSGKVLSDFLPDPLKTFNRGYTTYFLIDRDKAIASPYTPKSLGEPVGKVATLEKTFFTLDSDTIINPGDGICFFDTTNTLQGTAINKVIENRVFPEEIKFLTKGTQVFRNHDSKFEKLLKNAKIERLIEVKMSLTDNETELILSVIDEDGVKAEAKVQTGSEQAKNNAMLIANLEKQLQKLGGTDFHCSELSTTIEHYNFIPVKEINELRRQAIDNLITARQKQRPTDRRLFSPTSAPYFEQKVDYSANILNNAAANFYKRHGVRKMEMAAETLKDMTGKKVMTTKHCLKYQFDLCSKHRRNDRFKEPLTLIDEQGKRYRLNFNCKDCVMEVYIDPRK